MTDSQHLLAEYRRNGSDAAFRELVGRFVALVYSTALRLVEGDTHRAEDVTQTVFLDLARKARTLPDNVRLGGWLHRDTCLVAGHTLRGERRRQARERQAVEMNTLQNHSEADFSQVAPLLDEAINELGEADRTAILLRFFEQQDFRAVGQALGSNEDAARMRVTRALEKLENFLKRRGVTTSAASLGVVLTANAVQAAPVGLAVTISTAAALAGTTVATTATAIAIKTIAMTTLQKAIIGVTLAVAVGTGIYEARQNSKLRDQNESLQQQTAQLKTESESLSKRLATVGNTQSPSAKSLPDE
jgi:RNA polymerase sigma factor (sigma-70 family)